MSTLVELRTIFRSRIGNPTTTSVANATLDSFLNEALDYIQDRFRFENTRNLCTFTTVASTQTYTLPSEYNHLMSVWDVTNQVRLTKRDDNWASANQDTTNTSKPTDYVHYKNWIALYPVPDGAYSIRVRHKATQAELSADGDTPVIPEAWHTAVWRYARYLYWEAEGDVQKAEFAFDAWDRWLETKPVEVDEELASDNEQGMYVPELAARSQTRLDFDHSS